MINQKYILNYRIEMNKQRIIKSQNKTKEGKQEHLIQNQGD